MSILIKGMEMPTSCCECAIKSWNGEDDVCPFSGVSALGIGRQDDCPLVPVPPHGRLGDLDKLENGLRHMAKYQHGERQQGILGCCETIRLAPTIIPAEEGKT